MGCGCASRGDTTRIVEGTSPRRGTHNEKRQLVVRRLVDMLVARYKEALVRNFRSGRSMRALTDRATRRTAAQNPWGTSRASSIVTPLPTPLSRRASHGRGAARGLGVRAARSYPQPSRGPRSARALLAGHSRVPSSSTTSSASVR
jgi:hypothetical protein